MSAKSLNVCVVVESSIYFMLVDSISNVSCCCSLFVEWSEIGDTELENAHKVTSFGLSKKIRPESFTKKCTSPAALNTQMVHRLVSPTERVEEEHIWPVKK